MRRRSHSLVSLLVLLLGGFQASACGSSPSPGSKESEDSGRAESDRDAGKEMDLPTDEDLALGDGSMTPSGEPGQAGSTSEVTSEDGDNSMGGTTSFDGSGGRAGLTNSAGGRPGLNASGASAGESGGGDTADSGGASVGVGGSEAGREPASFAEIAHMIHQGCAGTVCHSRRQRPELTDDEGLHDRLLSYRVEECGDAPLVDPGSPETSAILMVVTHQCGELAMPDGCVEDPCVSQDGIDIISEWILAGAPDR